MSRIKVDHIHSYNKRERTLSGWILYSICLAFALVASISKNLDQAKKIERLEEDLAVYQTGALKSMGDRILEIHAIKEE